MKNIISKIEDGKILLVLSKQIYEKEAVLATAYKFTDRCTILIEPYDKYSVGIYFQLNDSSSESYLEQIAKDFCNEVLDQQIRLDLEKKYGNIRKLIVEQAFSPISNLKNKIEI